MSEKIGPGSPGPRPDAAARQDALARLAQKRQALEASNVPPAAVRQVRDAYLAGAQQARKPALSYPISPRPAGLMPLPSPIGDANWLIGLQPMPVRPKYGAPILPQPEPSPMPVTPKYGASILPHPPGGPVAITPLYGASITPIHPTPIKPPNAPIGITPLYGASILPHPPGGPVKPPIGLFPITPPAHPMPVTPKYGASILPRPAFELG